MGQTVKVARCCARAAGTGARCTLAAGHAAAHTAAGAEWPSEASEAIVDLLIIQQKLRSVADELRADLTMPTAAHSPDQLYRWFQAEFPTVFPSARTDLNSHAKRAARAH